MSAKYLFAGLALPVCATVVMLLPWALVGVLVAVGVFGLLGLAGLLWSWLGLCSGKLMSTAPALRVGLLGSGLFAASFGVMGFGGLGRQGISQAAMPLFLLAQWSAIYAVLALFFLLPDVVFSVASKLQRSAWLKGYRVVAPLWLIFAAVGVLPFLWMEG